MHLRAIEGFKMESDTLKYACSKITVAAKWHWMEKA